MTIEHDVWTAWQGAFEQGDEKWPMSVRLRFAKDGAVEGDGEDEVGVFVLRGVREGERIALTKAYATHEVAYEGTLDEAQSAIGGTWRLDEQSGAFSLQSLTGTRCFSARNRRGRPMSDVRNFLIGLGLERYAEVFERNEIELTDLEMLSDTDLQGLGIEALGPRRRILGAIAARRSGVAVGADPLAAAGTFVAARSPSAAASGAVDALSAGGTAFVPSTASSSGSGGAAVKATGLSAGTRLGKYTVLKELGRGSMG
jgi:hypothetical protein